MKRKIVVGLSQSCTIKKMSMKLCTSRVASAIRWVTNNMGGKERKENNPHERNAPIDVTKNLICLIEWFHSWVVTLNKWQIFKGNM